MPTLKVHLIKYFTPQTRLLILGPLDIEPKTLKRIVKKLDPSLILLIDGGTRHKRLLNKKEQQISLSVGDGDSTENSQTPLDIHLPTKKDFSDLAFVVEAILKTKKNFQQISLLGLSSHKNEERIDHLLFNIGIVQKLTRNFPIKIVMDERFLFLPSGKHDFEYFGIFSVISLTSNSLKLTGKADYQLKNWTKFEALNSLGLSNQARGKIQIESTRPVLIYFAGTKFNS
jgi:thiamine pyrophosphokinase